MRALDVIIKEGKPTIVCESYIKSKKTIAGPTSTSGVPSKVTVGMMTLLDIFLVDLNTDSELKRIWKPRRTLSIQGISSTSSVQDFCEILVENNMFGYQFVDGDTFFIRGVSQNFEYFNRIPFSKSYDVPNSRTYWGTVANKKDHRSNEQLFYKQGFNNVAKINYNGFLRTADSMLLYHLHEPTGKLQFTILKQN